MPSLGGFLLTRIICADVAATIPPPIRLRVLIAFESRESDAVKASADCGNAPTIQEVARNADAGGIVFRVRVANPLMARLAIAEAVDRLLLDGDEDDAVSELEVDPNWESEEGDTAWRGKVMA